MTKRDDDIGDWIETEATGGGLAMLGWGLGTVVALVLAFASWQYAPTARTQTARGDLGAPDPSEITGSIGGLDEARSSSHPARSYGIGRLAPQPLAGDESPATSRDIDLVRAEIAEIRRRISQIGMAGEGVARRMDGIEERMASAVPTADPTPPAAAPPPLEPITPSVAPAASAPPPPTEKTAATEKADKVRPETRTAERLPMPIPRPMIETPAAPVTATYDGDGPATTGAVPRTARHPEKPASGDARPEVKPEAKVEAPAPADPLPAAAGDPQPTRTARLAGTGPAEPAAQPMSSAVPPAAGASAAAIDLGGFRSLASLRRAWTDTSVRHTALTKDLEPLARLRETETGMEARLLAGPFPDQIEAAKACLRLKAVGATCAVTTYGGQPVLGLR